MKIRQSPKTGKYSITDVTGDEYTIICDALLMAAQKINETPAPTRAGKVDRAALDSKDRRMEQFTNLRQRLQHRAWATN